MKNLFSFITLLILLHTITEAHPDAPVLDIDGNMLLRGNIYYPMPVTFPGHGSGIVPYPIPNEICTYGVSQLLYGSGLPLIFTVNSSVVGGVIFDYNDLDISFSSSIGCGPSDFWKRSKYDEATEQYFIMIGTLLRGNEGNGTVGDAFQIRKAGEDYYKFVFCPETCISCERKCDDVGIFSKDGVNRLSVSGDTSYHIRFRKYEPELKLEHARY